MENKEIEFRYNLNLYENLGYDKLIVYTHAYHESGGFKKVIGFYNFWGIKKPKIWNGLTINIQTHEYINGIRIAIRQIFIDFQKIEEAIKYYDNLIKRLYPFSYGHKKLYKMYFDGLTCGKYKYATDPNYSKKLIELYELFYKNNVLRG